MTAGTGTGVGAGNNFLVHGYAKRSNFFAKTSSAPSAHTAFWILFATPEIKVSIFVVLRVKEKSGYILCEVCLIYEAIWIISIGMGRQMGTYEWVVLVYTFFLHLATLIMCNKNG